ncbi:unnamed protein product [Chilo suppressalis]|uniref:acid phosphatase n=1 Tax=Chilo suppressalis TaxID=168631 RepID=A0ABN8AWU2_CHISP|nr:unnamed protein product [Chilo suppressalis]
MRISGVLVVAVAALLAVTTLVTAKPDPVIKGTELVLTFLVHRHGDRTPVESTIPFSNNPTELRELSAPYGLGQLTNVGKQRAYKLGEYIRSRYEELLRPQYNRSEVFIRSTDSTRAKMTALASLAAVYPPGESSWSQQLRWTPVPYTTVPVKYDFNTAFANCPVFMEMYTGYFTKPYPSMDKYKEVLTMLSSHVGIDLNTYFGRLMLVYDVFVSQLSMGLPLDPEIQKQFSLIQEAAGKSFDLIFGNESYIDLQAGVLLSEFFKKAGAVIAGNDTQRLRIYSGHDFNVYSFEAVTQISNRQGVPKYASAYALELRKVVKSGKYVVLPVYLPEPGAPVKYLQIKGCSQLCDLNKFRKITAQYVLDEDTWRTKCGFNKDMEIDESGI